MGDLISRSALIEKLEEIKSDITDDGFGKRAFLGGIVALIDIFPTVEAVPVVHGEWIYENYTWHCGKCGFHPFKGYIPATPGFNFCPNCGAKMDGKKTGHLVEIVRMIKDSGMTKEELERLFFGEEGVKND